jgi:hypothetical protein
VAPERPRYATDRIEVPYCSSTLPRVKHLSKTKLRLSSKTPTSRFRIRPATLQGFSATIYGEEGEEEFRLRGESDADAKTKVAIHGRWVADL